MIRIFKAWVAKNIVSAKITCRALVLTYVLAYVQLAKWIAEKRKQPLPGHLLMLSLCDRVIGRVTEITNR